MKTRFGLKPEQLRILILLGILNVLVIGIMGWAMVRSILDPHAFAPSPPTATTPPPSPTVYWTATPRPTPTPDITPTPHPMTAEEYTYITELNRISSSIAGAMENTADMMDMAAVEPALWFNVDWKMAIATQLALIRIAAGDMREMVPSNRIVPCHNEVLVAANYYDDYIDKLANGMDTNDTTAAKDAVEDLKKAVNMHQMAKDCIKKKIPGL